MKNKEVFKNIYFTKYKKIDKNKLILIKELNKIKIRPKKRGYPWRLLSILPQSLSVSGFGFISRVS